MRRLTAWLKSDTDRTGPLSWVRLAIPVAVLIVILFWIILVFMNNGFWMFRETASLPVAKRSPSHADGPREIRIKVGQTGQISIIDAKLTTQELVTILNKVENENDNNIPVEIRADANITWRKIQPVLSILRKTGCHQTAFVIRDNTGVTSSLRVFVNAPPTNNPATIMRRGETLTLDGKPYTMKELRTVVAKLCEFNSDSSVCFSADQESTVQDVIDIVGMYNEGLVKQPLFLIDPPAMQNIGGKQQSIAETNTSPSEQ